MFKEQLEIYKKLGEDAKREAPNGIHPVWEKAVVTLGTKKFDEKVFNERKRYLLGLSEEKSITLDDNDKYDRIRYIRQSLVPESRDLGKDYTTYSKETKASPRGYSSVGGSKNGQLVIYKDWMRD